MKPEILMYYTRPVNLKYHYYSRSSFLKHDSWPTVIVD